MAKNAGADAYWLVALILVTVAFRLALLDPFSLHEDEALYAAYAAHIARTGDFFLEQWTGFAHDKPPLFFWILAGVIRLLGNTETSIRILSLAAEIGSTTLVYLIALRLGGTVAAVVAGTLYATSLLASLHGVSVFIDPLTITFGLAAILLATHQRYLLAGVLLGISVSMKLLAALYVPVLGVCALMVGGLGAALQLAGGLFAAMALLFGPAVFSSLFGEGSYLGRGMQNQRAGFEFDGERWRLKITFFINLFEWLFASRFCRIVVYAGIVGGLSTLVLGPRQSRWLILSGLLSVLAYYLGLSIVSSPVYDRYFLYAIPIFALVGGIGVARLLDWLPGERYQAAIAALFFVLLVGTSAPAIRHTARADVPFSALSRSDLFGGYVPLCNWLVETAEGRRVWHRSLGWHLDYCLQGRAVERSWFSDPARIMADNRPALLALSPRDPEEYIDALRQAGWSADLQHTFGGVAGESLKVYAIAPPDAPPEGAGRD